MSDQTSMTDYQSTTYTKDRGRIDWGSTMKDTVIFHTPFPNTPSVMVDGIYIVSCTAAGFSLDRPPDSPLTWTAQETPMILFEIDDIRPELAHTSQAPAVMSETPKATAAQRAACRSLGTKQCAPICMSHLPSFAEGECPEAHVVWSENGIQQERKRRPDGPLATIERMKITLDVEWPWAAKATQLAVDYAASPQANEGRNHVRKSVVFSVNGFGGDKTFLVWGSADSVHVRQSYD